jgi:peptidoglycan/xylan/chitin deacetylase (PgdA/CDA1 family)
MPALKSIVQRTATIADRIMAPPDGITILIYHRVGGGTDSEVDLPVEQFDRQLAYLAEHHRVISLDEAVTELTAGIASGWAAAAGSGGSDGSDGSDGSGNAEDRRRAVVITFDDGTDDFTEHAVPALQRHGLPATLYVATQFVEDGEPFPWGAPPTTWDALRSIPDDARITIGSHTHAHWLLDRLESGQVDADLDRSIELLRDRLGVDPAHFAYPKAVAGSSHAEVAVRRRFRTATLARSRVNRVGHADLHRLWRTPVQRSDDDTMFARKANGGMRLEGEVRSLTARVRYRSAAR